MSELVIDVVGTPAPQGSKKGFYNHHTQRVQMAESSKKVAPWRQDVVAAAAAYASEIGWEIPLGPLEVSITFHLVRPRYHYRTGKRANELRPNAPRWVDKKPDLDKLARSSLDALTTAAVIKDDSQVARLVLDQQYADGPTGARITIRPLDSVLPTSQGEGSEGSTDQASEQGVLL